jgi:hypothetical protein
MGDGKRMVEAIRGAPGKRLMYRGRKNGSVVKAVPPSREKQELLDSIEF